MANEKIEGFVSKEEVYSIELFKLKLKEALEISDNHEKEFGYKLDVSSPANHCHHVFTAVNVCMDGSAKAMCIKCGYKP